MKMLSFLAEELSNSATFFSKFADVDTKSISGNGTATCGRKSSDTWKPGKYSDQIKVTKAVEKYKETVNCKNVSEKNQKIKCYSIYCYAKKSTRIYTIS